MPDKSGQIRDFELSAFRIKGFRSIGEAFIREMPRLTILVGKNNAGKSNVMDALRFLSEAGGRLEGALARRGRSVRELTRNKSDEAPIEFELTFNLSQPFRAGILRTLFGSNKEFGPEDASRTRYLTEVTYSVSISEAMSSESLTTPNVLDSEPRVSIVETRIAGSSVEVLIWEMQGLCAQLRPGRSLRYGDGSSYKYGTTIQLALGTVFAYLTEATPKLLATRIRDLVCGLRWIDPVRDSPPSSQILGQEAIASGGGNLPDVLHSLYTNYPDIYREIVQEAVRILPEVSGMLVRTSGNTTSISVSSGRMPPKLTFSLDQMSYGTRTGLIILTGVLSASDGELVCIEEPEATLHPRMQELLLEFLRRASKFRPIVVSTHSPVIVGSSPRGSVFLVRRAEDGGTKIDNVDSSNFGAIVEELEIRPSYNFEADVVAFVEGDHDPPIYQAWAQRLGGDQRVQFIGCFGWTTIEYFANAKILTSRRVHAKVIAIFDGDAERGEKAALKKKEVIELLGLAEDKVLTLPYAEIEGSLMDAKAILAAFPAIHMRTEEIEAALAGWQTKRDIKGILERIFAASHIGRYDGEKGAKIASFVDEVPIEIKRVFEQIQAAAGNEPHSGD